MNAVPKMFTLTEPRRLRVIPADGDMLVIECDVVHPPSSQGKTVYVFFDVEQTTLLLKEARDAAIRARSRPDAGEHYRAVMDKPVVLTPEDEERIAALLSET